MSELLDYLNVLDKDGAAREAHNLDPKASMTKHGLSENEQSAFMTGDRKTVADAIGIAADELPSIVVTKASF